MSDLATCYTRPHPPRQPLCATGEEPLRRRHADRLRKPAVSARGAHSGFSPGSP